MADFRPFRGLRYRSSLVEDPGALLAPPYDVIDAAEQAALHAASPHNVIRLELGEERPDDTLERNRYTRAAETLASWRREGVVTQDEGPAYYVYAQEFEYEGKRQRTHLLGRLRLEPWEAGVVRPHEQTMRAPKEDRLRLLRHLRANVSPIFLAHHNAHARPPSPEGEPLIDATTADGQRHTLYAITQAKDEIAAAFAELPLYVLDGHHRYETALAYRDECRARAASWSGEEPENFVLAALTASDDPGLLLLPTHRLVRPPSLPADLAKRLERFFHVEDATPKSYDGTALLRLLARLSAGGASGTAIGALGLEEGRLHLLTLRDGAAARALMPERSRTWQELDVNVLAYAVLRETLGVGGDAPGQIDYANEASEAQRAVEAGRWPLAFLLNATRMEQMIAVAEAGERMPAKSTFFWPKLATGLVIHAFE